MSKGTNLVTLLGNLGADPEFRETSAGPMLKLRLATGEIYFDKEKKKHEHTEWHSITMFGNRTPGLNGFLKKGATVLVHGRLRTSSYDKDGQKHWRTEVIAEQLVPVGGRRTDGPRRTDARSADDEASASSRPLSLSAMAAPALMPDQLPF